MLRACFPPHRVSVIPNAVDASEFEPAAQPVRLKPGDPVTIIGAHNSLQTSQTSGVLWVRGISRQRSLEPGDPVTIVGGHTSCAWMRVISMAPVRPSLAGTSFIVLTALLHAH